MAQIDIGADDWPAILYTLRQLVVRAGYADWDAHAASALNGDNTILGRDGALAYLKAFIDFQSILTSASMQSMAGTLSHFVRDQNERPVSDISIALSDHYEPGLEIALTPIDIQPTDTFVAELRRIVSDLSRGIISLDEPGDGPDSDRS